MQPLPKNTSGSTNKREDNNLITPSSSQQQQPEHAAVEMRLQPPDYYNPHFTGYHMDPATSDRKSIWEYVLVALSIVFAFAVLPISIFHCLYVIREYERAVIFRLGRLRKGRAHGPGIIFVLPFVETARVIDLRTVSFDVPPQEILTKDSVTVNVDAVVYFRINDATVAVTNVESYNLSTRLLAATTLRTVLGTRSLSEILSERHIISHIMQSSLDEATAPWGVKVERVEIKDVRLPISLQRAMATEAEAARAARAKVIAAEGEQKASRALSAAADVLAGSPQAIQLRYLETLHSIAAEKNSTIVFPLPIDLMSCFINSMKAPQGAKAVDEAPLGSWANQTPADLSDWDQAVEKK